MSYRISHRELSKMTFVISLLVLIYTAHAQPKNKSKPSADTIENLTRFVDPYIGTGFHGHVFLGANVPFGAVQLGPVNISEGWDWCSGYHYSDSTIIGFSHTHLSGTGIGDLGDILLMPVTGNVKSVKGKLNEEGSGYYSLFNHSEEKARAGYYSVRLKRYNISVELTATERVGFHQYSFPSDDARIIIDLKEGIGWDQSTKTFLQQIDDTTVSGYRYSKGWAADQRIYFTAQFSKPVKNISLFEDTVLKADDSLTGKRVKGVLTFDLKKGDKILVKLGISPVNIENAAANISAEIPHWNFNKVVALANDKWNKELNKIQIQTPDPARLRTFYTALYHTMIAPSIFSDHNGDYSGTDKKIYRNPGFTNLTTFSLWDTYRGAHPLYTIFQRERVNDMIRSMLAIYRHQGKLPVWHLAGNETNTMPGYSAVEVLSDAYLKGFKGFDSALAWEAVKTTAMQDERGLYYLKKYGFIPADSIKESVAIAMEYAIADGAIAQMAKRMNKPEDYSYFSKRAKYYRQYFDPQTRFVRGKISATSWRTPFNPFSAVHMNDDFTEGNAWQYTWLAPHDVNGLIQLMGGETPFIKKLDSLFVVEGDLGKEASPDISGLIGQYAHGNEPSHHIAYLYAYAGQPWKTAEKIRFILDSLYTDKPDGLCGNEDVGQMSAWYILSALGFYQVNPFDGIYVMGSPVVNEASLKIGNRNFHIVVKNQSAKNKYIHKTWLNGRTYTKSYIRYQDIIKGGELIIEMGNRPSMHWGVKSTDRPYSAIH